MSAKIWHRTIADLSKIPRVVLRWFFKSYVAQDIVRRRLTLRTRYNPLYQSLRHHIVDRLRIGRGGDRGACAAAGKKRRRPPPSTLPSFMEGDHPMKSSYTPARPSRPVAVASKPSSRSHPHSLSCRKLKLKSLNSERRPCSLCFREFSVVVCARQPVVTAYAIR